MVINYTNINKANNNISYKRTMTYDVENPDRCLKQSPNVAGLNWDPNPPHMLFVLCMLWYYLLDCTM